MNILAIIWEIICDIYWSIISPDARINEINSLRQLIDVEESTYENYKSKLIDIGLDMTERLEISEMRHVASNRYTENLRRNPSSFRFTRDVRLRYIEELKELNEDLYQRLDKRGYWGRVRAERPVGSGSEDDVGEQTVLLTGK